MKEVIDQLISLVGTHKGVAQKLNYSERQYRNIRRKITENEPIKRRVELLLSAKLAELEAERFQKNEIQFHEQESNHVEDKQ